jgi:hypothetical protein
MNTFLLGKEIKTLGSNNQQTANKPLLDMMPTPGPKPMLQTAPVHGNLSVPPVKTDAVIPKVMVSPLPMVKSTEPVMMPIKTSVIIPKLDVTVHEKIKHNVERIEESGCPEIKRDLEEIKRKLNIISGHDNLSAQELSIPQGSDSALLLAKQAGLNPNALVARHNAKKRAHKGHRREYFDFDPQQTCTQVCTTVVDNITYTNLVLLIVLVLFIYLMRN